MTDDTPLRCASCGEPIRDDQRVIRLQVGAGSRSGFSHLLLREDAYRVVSWLCWVPNLVLVDAWLLPRVRLVPRRR